MAAIPKPEPKTINAIYRQWESTRTKPRGHLGASQIGHYCERHLWLSFRWAKEPEFHGRMLRLFQRGHNEEHVFTAELRAVGVEVWEIDPRSGNQFSVSWHGRHFSGSADGVGKGLIEAPTTPHLLEFKTYNKQRFDKLVKSGVEKVAPQHVAQMQVYMFGLGLTRAYYLAVCKDNDQLYQERIHFDRAAAEKLVAKAHRIISLVSPPDKISEDASWYECKLCDHYDLCHQNQIADVNCRTCLHATPQMDGNQRWTCNLHGDLSIEKQRAGCNDHLFIPQIIPNAKTVDASDKENWVKYERKDGTTFYNGGKAGMSSKEITNQELS